MAFGGSPARTVTYTYASSVDANQRLSVTVADNSTGDGFDNPTVRTTTDWLGRTVSYTDAAGVVTTTAYDVAGRVTQVTVNKGYGTLEYAYDSATGRQTTMKLDGKVLASSQYDAASGALTGVSYPSGTTNAGNGSSGSFGSDARGRPTSVTWTGASSALLTSNSVTRTAGSRINHVWVDGVDQSVGQDSFTYDGAGRLTAYRLGSATGTYSFGAQAGTCSSGALSAGKSSNRVSRTVGASTYAYCYDWADRLTSTTEPGYTGTIAYNAHGNMTTVAGETHSYDMADRHVRTVKGTTTVSYRRDATDRIVQRVQGTSTVRYGFTGDGDSPDLTLDASGNLVERTVSLPGGALLTTRAGGNVWSYPNLTGDVAAVANQSGVKQGATTTYDPFGNVTAGAVPDNSAGNMDYGWKGQHLRPLERASGLVGIIEMGARQYSPVLGRFIEVDPIEGGLETNDYAYVWDPINQSDLNGEGGFGGHCGSMRGKKLKACQKRMRKVRADFQRLTHISRSGHRRRASQWGRFATWAGYAALAVGAVALTVGTGGAAAPALAALAIGLSAASTGGSAMQWYHGARGRSRCDVASGATGTTLGLFSLGTWGGAGRAGARAGYGSDVGRALLGSGVGRACR